MVVYIPSIRLPPVLVDRKHFGNFIKDYKCPGLYVGENVVM